MKFERFLHKKHIKKRSKIRIDVIIEYTHHYHQPDKYKTIKVFLDLFKSNRHTSFIELLKWFKPFSSAKK